MIEKGKQITLNQRRRKYEIANELDKTLKLVI